MADHETRQSVSLFLNLDGRRAGNAHDRRRIPPRREQQALARRWIRRAQERRRRLLPFEAYDTWVGHIWGPVSQVRYTLSGVGEFAHDVAASTVAGLADALTSDPDVVLTMFGDLRVEGGALRWRARNFGVHVVMENTVNLTWVHAVFGTSGEADVLPERFRLTGRSRR